MFITSNQNWFDNLTSRSMSFFIIHRVFRIYFIIALCLKVWGVKYLKDIFESTQCLVDVWLTYFSSSLIHKCRILTFDFPFNDFWSTRKWFAIIHFRFEKFYSKFSIEVVDSNTNENVFFSNDIESCDFHKSICILFKHLFINRIDSLYIVPICLLSTQNSQRQ